MLTHATPTPKQGSQVTGKSSPKMASSSFGLKTEKNDMINLNNRMAVYVDKVRSLESENRHLSVQFKSLEEQSENKISNMRLLYEAQINSTTNSLNEMSNKYAALEITNQNLQVQYEESVNRSEAIEVKCQRMENELSAVSNELNEKQLIFDEINDEKKEYQQIIVNLRDDLEKYSDRLKNEQLEKVQLKNTIQTLKEKIDFKDRLYEEEIKESRKYKQVIKISEQGSVSKETMIQEHLENIREQQEAENEEYRENLERIYNGKLDELRNNNTKLLQEKLKCEEEKNMNAIKSAKLIDANKKIEKKLSVQIEIISQLEDKLKQLEENKRITLGSIILERDEARAKLEEVEKESVEFQQSTMQLQREIDTYKNLLEGEELRLNITPSPATRSPSSRIRRKRKRVVQTGSNSEQTAKRKHFKRLKQPFEHGMPRDLVGWESLSTTAACEENMPNGQQQELDDLFHDRQNGNNQDSCGLM